VVQPVDQVHVCWQKKGGTVVSGTITCGDRARERRGMVRRVETAINRFVEREKESLASHCKAIGTI
jgi:hypothetical protein